ncbi:trimeric intracellular cation channel family protein [Acidipropionibacterium timonense]|uniref:trimeric intracellular cation channel family protein n=1 Tax=Acidipropionibacterium timonense TaxID=2161818 RepID=UPI001030C898|nr:trimeric intracellular cation channel family protein [Acidipropionibacterium timonense]
MDIAEAIRILDLVGVFANAILGGMIARKERLDAIGFLTLGVLSGLGGGMLRDVLLQHGLPSALADPTYLVVSMAGCLLCYLARISRRTWDLVWPTIDAVALGTWAVAGTSKALAQGLHWLPAILMGTITAVGGGAIRDIAVRRVPSVFGGNTLYATCAIAGSALYVVMARLGLPGPAVLVATVFGAAFVLVARWRGWVLPQDWQGWEARRLRARIPARVRRRDE